jgi:hypothetical protein
LDENPTQRLHPITHYWSGLYCVDEMAVFGDFFARRTRFELLSWKAKNSHPVADLMGEELDGLRTKNLLILLLNKRDFYFL